MASSTPQASAILFEGDLGRDRKVSFKEYGGKRLLHIRLYAAGFPTLKGICMPVQDVEKLIGRLDDITESLDDGIGNVFEISPFVKVSVTEFGNVDFRYFWTKGEGSPSLPSKKGVNLRREEYDLLADILKHNANYFISAL